MKRFVRIIIPLLLLYANTAMCGDGFQGASGTNRTMFIAGFTNFRPYALNDRFALTGANELHQLTTFGIGVNATLATGRRAHVDAAFNLMLYDLAEVQSPLDSSVLKIWGWELMTSMYGYDVLKKVKWVDLTLGPGAYWGNVKLAREAQIQPNLKMRYKNPFVAPMLRIDLRFNFWRLSVGGRASFHYDITGSKWKERDGDLIDMPGYRFREAQYVVYIGINFINWDKVPNPQPTEDVIEE